MAQIGYGYGSEFQLLRFLGHHRNDLDKMIKEQAGINQNIPIEWFDFNYGDRDKKIIADDELQGFSFLPIADRNKVKEDWPKIKENWQSWDAVFKAGDTYYIVEAKAHLKELQSTGKHGGESRDEILTLMQKTLEKINVVPNEKWLGNYYQFANRLTTTMFMNQHDVKTKLLCLFFTNGYSKRVLVEDEDNKTKIIKEVLNKDTTKEDFQDAIKKELEELGLTNVDLSKYVVNVFIDANKRSDK